MSDWQSPPQQGWANGQPQWSTGGVSDPFQNTQQPWEQQQQWGANSQAYPGWSAAPAQAAPGPQFQQPAPQQTAWQPNFAGMVDLGDPMLNVGLQAGAHLVQEHAEKAARQYMPGVTSFWGALKKYFNVNNTYVLKKLYTIFFPFIKKDWARSPTMDPPAQDPNSPDLYIPLMALSTYVLTVGLAKGSSMTFNPEVIVDTFGTSVMVLLVQVVLIRIAQLTLVPWVPSIPWLELVAYTGYLFTGVAVNMFVGILFGHTMYNISLLWTGACAAFTLYQTMRAVVPPPEPGQRGKRRRVNFFIVVAVLQIFVMWFLGYTRELRSDGFFSLSKSEGFVPNVPAGVGRDDAFKVPHGAREELQHNFKGGKNGRFDTAIEEEEEEEEVVERQKTGSRKKGRRQQQQQMEGTDV